MVFVDFDREDVNFHEFCQNILSQARSSVFFMYIMFFLEIKSSWINLGFSVENVVENEGEILNPNTFPLYNHVFDDIFDWKSKIYPWWLDFQKKNDIHEKCGRASLTQNILSKFVEIYVFPVKIYKNHKKMCKLFTVWFPKELTNVQVFSEFARISPNFRILFRNREFVNLFWWFFLQSCLKFKVS